MSHPIKLSRDPFRNLSADEASRKKLTGVSLTARRNASQIQFSKLHLNKQQIEAIE